METLVRDLRLAVRLLIKNPGFAVAAVLCLALGIGASSAVFSVVNAILVRALPYKDPDRIVLIWGPGEGDRFRPCSAFELFDFRQRVAGFEQVAGSAMGFLNLTGRDEPERLVVARLSPDFLPLLGVAPQLGHGFERAAGGAADERVVLLSAELWHRRFAGDPGIVGSKLTLNDEPYTVIGVMPETFHFKFGPVASDLFVSLPLDSSRLPPRNVRTLGLAARLKPGVTVAQAQQQVDALAARFRAEHPESYPAKSWRIALVPLYDGVVSRVVRLGLLVLAGAVGLVLLVAYANVANLMLVRATTREKEVALRLALGAGRSMLLRQFLAESVVLAAVGGGLGLLLAGWGLRVLVALNPEKLPRLEEVRLDGASLAFTLLVALLTTVACGLLPALLAARVRLNDVLKSGGKTAAAGSMRHRLRHGLVVVEVAFAMVVLIAAGLIVQSFRRLQQVDPGFDTANLLTLQVFMSSSSYATDAQRTACADRLLAGLRAIPGVERASLVNSLPLSEIQTTTETAIEGQPPAPGEAPPATDWRAVSPGYFKTLGIPLRRGRDFTDADQPAAPRVAIIDESMARRYWPGQDPLGRRLQLNRLGTTTDWITVVGVVGHVRAEGPDATPDEQVYTPYAQSPRPLLSIALRTAADPLGKAAAVRRVVWAVDRELPVEKVQTMEQIVERSLAGRRSYSVLLAILAGVALLLAVVGVYGVMAYSVSRRVQEIGVRLALGAQRAEVLKMVAGQGLRLAATGIVLGLLLAFGISRFLRSLLFGLTATDALTYVAVVLLLLGLALLSAYLPARRATRIDPLIALRWE